MTEILDIVGRSEIGAIALVTICVLAILSGRLVPVSTVEKLQKSHEEEVDRLTHVVEMWRQAASTVEEARQVEATTRHEFLELGRLTNEILSDMRSGGRLKAVTEVTEQDEG